MKPHSSLYFTFREVDTIIQELGLVKAQQTIIGNERTRGVSGGERRVRHFFLVCSNRPSILKKLTRFKFCRES